MTIAKKPYWLTETDVPPGTPKREYSSDYLGNHFHMAAGCLEHGYEDNAASWMWRDIAEFGEFKPVAGTLELGIGERGQRVIHYVDAEDIAEQLTNTCGDGI